MKALLLSLVAASALAVAVTPAAAQSYQDRGENHRHDQGPGDRGGDRDASRGYQARSDQLLARISEAQHDGRITATTAQHERREIAQTDHMYLRERNTGMLSEGHRADLDRRYDNMVHRFEEELARGAQTSHHGDDHRRGDDHR